MLLQGRAACKKLDQKLTADLQMFPDNEYLSTMQNRVKGNLGEQHCSKHGNCDLCASLC
jgi:hypothetical protein